MSEPIVESKRFKKFYLPQSANPAQSRGNHFSLLASPCLRVSVVRIRVENARKPRILRRVNRRNANWSDGQKEGTTDFTDGHG